MRHSVAMQLHGLSNDDHGGLSVPTGLWIDLIGRREWQRVRARALGSSTMETYVFYAYLRTRMSQQ
jgi:hypothetical protein